VLHARDAVAGDRWLQRAYFTSSLEPFRHRAGAAPDEFVFDAFELLRKEGRQQPARGFSLTSAQ
jgi:hypothetical protein